MLNAHMVTHATFKRHKCQYCNAHFKSPEEMLEHVKQSHVPGTSALPNIEEGSKYL